MTTTATTGAGQDGGKWLCTGRRAIFTHPILTLEQQDLTNPRTGHSQPFFVMRLPDWVSVLVLTDDGDVVLVRQMRAGIAGPSLELPGGLVDPGELPEAAARREVLEETGFSGGTLESLGWVHPNPPIQDNRCHFFLLRGATLTAPLTLDPAEDIAVERHPLAAVQAMLLDGSITHALVFAAFLKAAPALRGLVG
jgi:ADP-ribose pyrophosphatase